MDELTDHTVVIILQHTHTHTKSLSWVYTYTVFYVDYISVKLEKIKGRLAQHHRMAGPERGLL